MAEKTHNAEDRLAKHSKGTNEHTETSAQRLLSGASEWAGYPLAFLRDPNLGGRGNSEARTQTLQTAQRTHGNRAVQRYISIQRCGPTPCGCSAEEKANHELKHMLEHSKKTPLVPMQHVQRQTPHVPAPADPNYTGTQGGDAYVGPGGGAGIGGLVSYGCYCGPGGDAITGSRCGPGAPPKDAIDATCMQHDSDYNKAGVDSGSTPGTVNMFTDFQGWLRSEEADRRLADSAGAAMEANPGGFSPSAMLFGQGIKGVFGGRANISHALNWGLNKFGEGEAGLSGAYNDASNWGSNALGEAESGIGNFLTGASNWSSASDVASGVAGGASDAANWLGKTGSEAFGGATSSLGSAGSWLGNTAYSAASGTGEAMWNMGSWGIDTAAAVGNVGIDLAGQGISAASGAASDVAGWGANKARGLWDSAASIF